MLRKIFFLLVLIPFTASGAGKGMLENCVNFEVGGLFGHTEYTAIDCESGRLYYVRAMAGSFTKYDEYKKAPLGESSLKKGVTVRVLQLSQDEQAVIVSKINGFTLKWKKSYINNDILDGIQWQLVVGCDGSNREYLGSNAFPENWGEFRAYLADLIELNQ